MEEDIIEKPVGGVFPRALIMPFYLSLFYISSECFPDFRFGSRSEFGEGGKPFPCSNG
jgi:hypothetical protein